MGKKTYTNRIPRDFIVLCNTYSELTNRSNRAWLATGSLSLVAVASILSNGSETTELTGVLRVLASDMFFPSLCLVVSLTNFHFLVLISQCFQMQRIFLNYLDDTSDPSIQISESVSLKDLAHHMNRSGFNRFVPAIMEIKDTYRERVSDFVKPISDLFYLGVPASGIIAALVGMYTGGVDWSSSQLVFIGLAASLALFSIICSVLGFFTATQARKRWQKEIALKKLKREEAKLEREKQAQQA